MHVIRWLGFIVGLVNILLNNLSMGLKRVRIYVLVQAVVGLITVSRLDSIAYF